MIWEEKTKKKKGKGKGREKKNKQNNISSCSKYYLGFPSREGVGYLGSLL